MTSACGPPGDRRWLCELVASNTESRGAARFAHYLSPCVTALLIVVGAVVLRVIVGVLVRRVVTRAIKLRPGMTSSRRSQRAATLSDAFASMASIVLGIVTVFAVLTAFGINIAPLLAGAGLAGVILGFGAQNLLRDVIAGTFMVFEDQFGVGDSVDFGVAVGVVEGISLRVTRLRDADGIVWHVPNGSVLRVANLSQTK